MARGSEGDNLLKVVIADTSPLNYLLLVDCDFLLPSLYGHIIVPPSVMTEFRQIGTPPIVAAWASNLPRWVEVRSPRGIPDEKLSRLDAGERDAIQLGLELSGATVLIDETAGRNEARARGLSIIGTLGVLRDGQLAGLVDAQAALRRLTEETTFRITPSLQQVFLASLKAGND